MNHRYTQFFEEIKEEHKDSYGVNDNVLIVDALNTYIRCFSAVPTMNDDGDHVGGITGFLKSVGLAVRTFKPTRCILVFDGRGGSQRRRKIFPEYKENRRHMQRLNRTYDFKDKADEDESRKSQLITLAQLLVNLPVTVMALSNVEADDVIAHLSSVVTERDGKSIILSTDRDFLQLVGDTVTVWNPAKKKLYKTKEVIEEFGIHPNNFTIYRALDGDKSDNLPGVKGIGRKTLLKHYPELEEEQKVGISDIIDYAEKQTKAKLFENIRSNRELIELNYTLMRLDEVQMSGASKLDVIRRFDDLELVLNKNVLTKQIGAYKMLDAFGNYDQWLITTWSPLTRFSTEKK